MREQDDEREERSERRTLAAIGVEDEDGAGSPVQEQERKDVLAVGKRRGEAWRTAAGGGGREEIRVCV